jgi:hypothetical protein
MERLDLLESCGCRGGHRLGEGVKDGSAGEDKTLTERVGGEAIGAV